MTITTGTQYFRVYPAIDSHHKHKETTYVNIRITSKANRNRTIDIPVYYDSGVRMKVKPKSFENGIIKKGYYDNTETHVINERIAVVWSLIKSYIGNKQTVSKKEVELSIYGLTFLKDHKKARTQQLTVKVTESKPTPYFIQLRKKYPKTRDITIISTIDDDGFEVDERKEIVIDPLSVTDPEFPKHFPKELYELAKKELNIVDAETNTFFLNSKIKFHFSTKFWNTVVTDRIKISNDIIDEFKTATGKKSIAPIDYRVNHYKDNQLASSKVVDNKSKLLQLKREKEIQNLPTEVIYAKDKYDKTNILHLFGSIYFDTLENQQNERVVIRIFDYAANTGVSTDVKDFTIEWANKFFDWIKKNGYVQLSAKIFDPLKHDKSIFTNPEKPREKYKPAGVHKQMVSFKVVSKHLVKKGLPKLDFSEITKISVKKGLRKTHHLLLSEFETLFNLKFSKSKLNDYQKLFDDLKDKRTIKGTFVNDITIDNLIRYRDIFCLQIMMGGLRGLDEYNTVEIIDFDKNGPVFRFLQEKVQKREDEGNDDEIVHVLNPQNKYTAEILKRTKSLPQAKSAEVLNGYLKVLGHIANLNREVQKGKKVMNNLSQYWARKSFGNILFSEGVSEEQIAIFTGHELRQTELSTSYLDMQNVKLKRDIYREKGFL